MGKIRSALEIALEKTKDIAFDKEEFEKKEEEEKIRRQIGSYMSADTSDDEKLEELSSMDRESVRKYSKAYILTSLSLPSMEVADDRYERLIKLASISFSKEAVEFISKITAFLKQYPVHKKDLVEKLEGQLEGMLREKEDEIREKTGRSIHLSIEDDKECLEIIKKNLEALDKQYNSTLENAKKELEGLL